MRRLTLLWFKPVLLAIACFHSTAGADSWSMTCEQLKDLPLPVEDRPSAQEQLSLKGCSSEELYYGIGKAAARESARKCAYLEREQDNGPVFGGPAVLMMIYANGRGAERNFDLAIKFACELEDMAAPMEMELRIEDLLNKKNTNWSGNDFELCDNITSGFMMGVCASHQAALDMQERKTRVEKLTAGWKKTERQAFEHLRQIADSYFDLRAGNELDQSGTGRVAFYVAEKESLNNKFIEMLESLENSTFSTSTASQFNQADRKLNAVYRKIHKIQDFSENFGTITQQGIRQTQRAWIVYRDAWVEFAGIKYQAVTKESIMSYLTQERTEMLGEFLD